MINEEKAKQYCCEDISKIYGYAEAVADKKNMWYCHHCLGLAYSVEQMIEKGLYYKQPAEMLMFVKISDHKMLHKLSPHYKEIGKKVSASKMGHGVSEETKQKISESHKGIIHTEETKQKIRLANTNNPQKSKKVLQFTTDGKFVAEYPSLKEVNRQFGYSRGNIQMCINGKRKTAYGFVWRLKEI